MAGAGIRANALQDLKPINFGKLQVQQHKLRQRVRIGAPWEQVVECLSTITRYYNFVEDVVLLQCAEGEGLVVRVVFHQKDGLVLHRPELHSASDVERLPH